MRDFIGTFAEFTIIVSLSAFLVVIVLSVFTAIDKAKDKALHPNTTYEIDGKTYILRELHCTQGAGKDGC